MNRRTALAAAAALSLSITGLAAAAGATMHVFDAADASPNVGKVSPVSTTTRPPVIERHVVIVGDPAPAPAPAPAPVTRSSGSREGSASPGADDEHEVATSLPRPTASPAAPTAPAAPAAHEPEHESGRELGDD